MTVTSASLVNWVVRGTKQNVLQQPDQLSDEDGGAITVNIPLVSPYGEIRDHPSLGTLNSDSAT